MKLQKTVYRGDLTIGKHDIPITMWSEKTKLNKPSLLNGDEYVHSVNLKFNCVNKETKDYFIRELRDLIKNKRDD